MAVPTSRKIKVAFFADILVRDFDGASRTMYQIIERIPNDKFEFMFFCGMEPTHEFPYPVFGVPAVRIPGNSTYKLAVPYFSGSKLKKALDDFAPDVIHIASPSPLGNFALKYRKSKDIPVLTIYHTHFLSYIEYYLKRAPFLVNAATKGVSSSQQKFYRQANLIYIPTEQIIKELKGYGFGIENMKIWQRGINNGLFSPAKKDASYLTNITRNDKPNVIFASRLVWEKNLATLIRIYKKSKAEGDKYNFIIVGDGVASQKLKEKMPGAFHLGKVDHETLAKLYASSDVFLFTSISETYGNVVVEAMASGCPCVIAKGGGSQSLVSHGQTGFLCEPNDESDYLKRIDQLVSDAELRSEIIANGIEYTKPLNWDSLAETYFADITHLAERSSTKSIAV